MTQITSPTNDQGKEYSTFIQEQLRSEDKRRESVTTRAATALTGATGLVTIVLAVFTVFLGKDFTLKGCAKSWLLVAIIALLLAAACAVLAGYPAKFDTPKADTLGAMVNNRWVDHEVDARNITAYINTALILSLRHGTEKKMKWLFAAAFFQLVAVGALVGCVLAVIGICFWPMNHVAAADSSTTTTRPKPPPSATPVTSTVVVTVTCPCSHHITEPLPKKDP
jgi:hypothetical protein